MRLVCLVLVSSTLLACGCDPLVGTPPEEGSTGQPGDTATPPGSDPPPDPGPIPDPPPEPGPPPVEPPVALDFWGVIDRSCVWCHTPEHPEAGFDFTTGSLAGMDLDLLATGIQLEMAPAIERLDATRKAVLLDAMAQRGATIPPLEIPHQYTWRLEEALADLPDGAAAPGFAFIVEDGYVDTRSWTVQTWTDRHGRTYRGIALDQQRQVDQSVFSSSRNPSSYLVFRGVPFHGRFFNSRMEGDVRVGRWMSVGMATRRLEPTGRAQREYVRLQFDRDAISLRSAPTRLETWPWGDEPDGRLRGTLNASGFYQTSSEWLHFVFESRRTSNGVQWTALVTNPATGEVLADLQGMESLDDPLQGTFFLHSYSTGDNDMWANLVFETEVDTAP